VKNTTTKRMAKKINYSDPVPREALNEILNSAFAAANNLEQRSNSDPILAEIFKQQINKTNMTDETTNMNTQTNTNTPNTTDENIPTWKKLCKSFVYMMITFMFVYAGFSVLTWLYDTLGMEHVMPTLIGLALWVAVYDHMYGTASKAPHIK
jgi:hypothetical protein